MAQPRSRREARRRFGPQSVSELGAPVASSIPEQLPASAEGFLVALYAATQTQRLSYLVAHRPRFLAPTLLARKIATFDHLTGGRLAVHIITGKSDDEQHGDGDFSPKDERYRRAAEYLQLMKLAWSNDRPFDFSGEFYRVEGAHSDVR